MIRPGPGQLAVLVSCILCGGCASSQVLGAAYPEEKRPLHEILRDMEQVPARDEQPVIVGVTDAEPAELFAWDLRAGLLWKREVKVTSAPRVAGDLVITGEKNGVVARDLATGNKRFSIDEDVRLVGADGSDGWTVIVMLLEPDDDPRGLVVAAHDGDPAWELETAYPAGTPAIAGKTVILPWGTQRVSFLSLRNGKERGRLHLRDSVAGHALVDRGNAFIAQHGFLRVNAALEAGSKEAAFHYSPAARPLPGQPGLLAESYEEVHPPSHASHRVRLDWRVHRGDHGLTLEDGTLYLHFYRFVFALDADTDAIRWVYQGPADAVGTAVQPGGVFVVDTTGYVGFLNALGHGVWHTQMTVTPAVVHVRPGNFVPSATEASSDETTDYAPRPLQHQLNDAARIDDARLSGGRTFAIEHLSRFDSAAVTEDLLEICDDPGAPEPVHLAACAKLGERKAGKEHVIAALKRRASFLQQVPPPPVGALARAAVSMGLRNAVPLLLAHVADPQTPTRDLAPAFEALAELGNPSTADSVERFVDLHHAEPHEDHLLAALSSAVNALAQLRGKAAKSDLLRLADDSMSMPGLADAAREAVARLDAPVQGESVVTAPEQPDKPAANPQPDDRPRYLSMRMVAAVLRPAEAKLRACVRKDGSETTTARISMVIHGGDIEGMFVTPETAKDCVEPILRKYRFPSTQGGRQQIVHVIQAGGRAGGAMPKAKRRTRPGRQRLSADPPEP